MLNCHKATQLLSESQERHLSIIERASVKVHTMMCPACDNFGKQVVAIGKISRKYMCDEKVDEYINAENPNKSASNEDVSEDEKGGR